MLVIINKKKSENKDERNDKSSSHQQVGCIEQEMADKTRRKSMVAFSVPTTSKVTGHILSHLINIVATWEAVLQMGLIPFKLCCTLYIKL